MQIRYYIQKNIKRPVLLQSILLPHPHIQVIRTSRLHVRDLVARTDTRALRRLARCACEKGQINDPFVYQTLTPRPPVPSSRTKLQREKGQKGQLVDEHAPLANDPRLSLAESDFLLCEPRMSELPAMVSPTEDEMDWRPPFAGR